jgi:hypothetical protein
VAVIPNALAFVLVMLGSFAVCVVVYILRAKQYRQFSVWWDAEGVTVFLITLAILGLLWAFL